MSTRDDDRSAIFAGTIVSLRKAVTEECAKLCDDNAALYRAYAERAADLSEKALMNDRAITSEDNARKIRSLAKEK